MHQKALKLIELKFLLKLLISPDYRLKISEIKLNKSTKASERNKICRELKVDDFIDITEKNTKIKITDAGKAFLKSDTADIPITPEEDKILKAASKQNNISPSDIKNVTPAKKRDEKIDILITKGLLEVKETIIEQVWLTEAGKDFLATKFHPTGNGTINLSRTMFADYLEFLRKYLSRSTASIKHQNGKTTNITDKPDDETILETIIHLDRQLNTDNYLPIFHLRNKLQPLLSRDELDKALYRLQNDDKIELSSLAEVSEYSSAEIDAGIPQPVGGSLFFILVNNNELVY